MDESLPKIAVIGAGLIGERHAKIVASMKNASLFGIVDPSEKAAALAANLECKYFSGLESFLERAEDCHGVVIATPNQSHRSVSVACIERDLPCLIEKPLASNSEDAEAIVETADMRKVAVLVGHHRRHHAVSEKLKELIANGMLGRIVGAQLCWSLRKPDGYFLEGDWRTTSAGGPLWINMIHEVDLLRYFLGEIVDVQSYASNGARNTPAEDTAIVNLRFATGALACAFVSDTAPSPWHFEGASAENPNIAATGQDGLRIFGSLASVSFPSLTLWKHANPDEGWGYPIKSEQPQSAASMSGEIALELQMENFVNTIKGHGVPLVTVHDGLQNVRVIEAIHASVKTGQTIKVPISPER